MTAGQGSVFKILSFKLRVLVDLWGPRARADVKDYVSFCYVHCQAKSVPGKPAALQQPLGTFATLEHYYVLLFTTMLWKVTFQLLNFQIHLSTSLYLASNGESERLNQILHQYLRCHVTYTELSTLTQPLSPCPLLSFPAVLICWWSTSCWLPHRLGCGKLTGDCLN